MTRAKARARSDRSVATTWSLWVRRWSAWTPQPVPGRAPAARDAGASTGRPSWRPGRRRGRGREAGLAAGDLGLVGDDPPVVLVVAVGAQVAGGSGLRHRPPRPARGRPLRRWSATGGRGRGPRWRRAYRGRSRGPGPPGVAAGAGGEVRRQGLLAVQRGVGHGADGRTDPVHGVVGALEVAAEGGEERSVDPMGGGEFTARTVPAVPPPPPAACRCLNARGAQRLDGRCAPRRWRRGWSGSDPALLLVDLRAGPGSLGLVVGSGDDGLLLGSRRARRRRRLLLDVVVVATDREVATRKTATAATMMISAMTAMP